MNVVKKVICTLVLVLIGICSLGKVQNAEAASVSKQLRSYDIFQKADLNGDGKEESIGIKKNQLENDGVKADIYINNKLKYEETIDWSDGMWIDIIDINPKDSLKEIRISSEYGHGEEEYYVYRYKKKKLTKLFHSEYGFLTNESNNDTVSVFETSQSRLGLFGYYRDCKIKNGALVPTKKKGVFKCRPDWFTAAQNIVVYKKDMKTVVKTLYKGDTFQVTKVKVAYDSETQKSKIKYAYIDTVSKKGAGWINIEGAVWFESDDPLVSDWYAWH